MERFSTAIIGVAFATGAMLTGWGLAHIPWLHALPWEGTSALFRFVVFLLICSALIIGGSLWSKRNALFVGATVAVGMALLAGALWPFLVNIWFAVASALLGKSILGALRIKSEGERWLTGFLVGAGVYGAVIGLLAHFPVNYPGVYGVLLTLPLIHGWRGIAEESKKFPACTLQKNLAGFNINKLDTAIAVVALIYFGVALMPEVGFDSLSMHLSISTHLALRHQWGFDASNYVWAVMPMLGDWIFSIGYMLAGETAARLINVGFIFILGWLVRDLVLWAGSSIVGAKWAVLLFLSTPLTFTEGSSLFIESVWASFVVAGTLAILGSCSTSGKPSYELPIAGLLLGCALAAKAVTLTILPVLLLLLIWRYRSWYKAAGLPVLMLGLSLFLAIALIPYLTAWWLTGNPVFPFFNHIFKSAYYPSGEADFAVVFGKGLTWDFWYRATFQSEKYLEATTGVAGFQWLLLFLPASVAILADRQWRGLVLVVVGVMSIALTFHSMSYLRYVFPAWAILTASVGLALGKVFSKNRIIEYLGWAAAVIAIALNLLFFSSGSFYRDFALKTVADESGRELYLAGRLPIRNAVALVNRLNTGRGPVAVFANPLTAGLSGDALYPSWYNVAFQKEIISVQTEQDFADILLKRGGNFVILDSNWKGVNCCPGDEGEKKQALIEKVTEKIAEYGSLSVRKIKADYLFKTEVLSNPDFSSINGWVLASEAKYDAGAGIILASVDSSATQVVAVSPGGRYLNTVVARCAKEMSTGRVQVNWLNAKGRFVNADIKAFECSSVWTEYTMEATAPLNAAKAVVYVTGNTSVPLEFKSNSLRQ